MQLCPLQNDVIKIIPTFFILNLNAETKKNSTKNILWSWDNNVVNTYQLSLFSNEMLKHSMKNRTGLTCNFACYKMMLLKYIPTFFILNLNAKTKINYEQKIS